MKVANTTTPESRSIRDISATRLTFSDRSFGEKLRPLQRFPRTLSPSRTIVRIPKLYNFSSNASAKVDLPLPERPVNQISIELCPFIWFRFSRVTLYRYGNN